MKTQFSAVDTMSGVRARLLLNHAFFGFPSMQLDLVENPNIPTARTNGRVLEFNPAFVDALPEKEKQALIAHEAAHCMLSHIWRGEAVGRRLDVPPLVVNVAADYIVNYHLNSAGFSMPDGWLRDDRLGQMSLEQAVSELAKDVQRVPQSIPGPGSDLGKPAQDEQGAGDGQGEAKAGDGPMGLAPGDARSEDEIEASWRVATTQAAQMAKAYGKLPGSMSEFTRMAKNRTVDWRSILREFASQLIPSDFSWLPGSRRHLWRGWILPGVKREAKPEIMAVIDTSGSTYHARPRFLSELSGLSSHKCVLHLVRCDTKATHIGDYDGEPIPSMNLADGGGTSFIPPFELAEKQGWQLDGVVYLTDGYGAFPKSERWPTLWVMCTDEKTPWGETVRITI